MAKTLSLRKFQKSEQILNVKLHYYARITVTYIREYQSQESSAVFEHYQAIETKHQLKRRKGSDQ